MKWGGLSSSSVLILFLVDLMQTSHFHRICSNSRSLITVPMLDLLVRLEHKPSPDMWEGQARNLAWYQQVRYEDGYHEAP